MINKNNIKSNEAARSLNIKQKIDITIIKFCALFYQDFLILVGFHDPTVKNIAVI